ncbi:hypothetical protein ISH75_31975, partial [Pseudomonas aeruginosa]|nr:hypothetical protein [Pseudomonas aeruginosa]
MTTERSPRVVPIDGQIDLVELAQGILRQKWLIASFFLLATALAVVYAFYSRPIYEARASVLPPSLNEISGFNLGRKESDLGVFSVKDIYDVFIRNLMAEETRQNFFKEKYLPTLGDKGAESLDAWRPQKLSATPDHFGKVLPHVLSRTQRHRARHDPDRPV